VRINSESAGSRNLHLQTPVSTATLTRDVTTPLLRRLRPGLCFTAFVALTLCAGARSAAACPGDCNRDGVVAVDEILVGINIALGALPLSQCPGFDANGDGEVAVDDVLAAIRALLDGCPGTPTPTATVTRTATPTTSPTTTGTATPTPTPTINLPPVIAEHVVYRGFPGNLIRLPIDAVDPTGDILRYAAQALPAGAVLDETTGVFEWTPAEDQLGPFFVDFTCTDSGEPPQAAEGTLIFKISPPDVCAEPECDPAAGCHVPLPEVTQSCCSQEPAVRVPEPAAGCPQGRVLFLGRNNDGFGRVQNCDTLRVINFAQSGAVVRFHVETRCIDAAFPVIVRADMRTSKRVMINNLGQRVFLQERGDGWAERFFVTFPVAGPTPFFDLEGAEANLKVTVLDQNGVEVEENLRLRLTFTPIPDLPETH
jgi:hypothetical protein